MKDNKLAIISAVIIAAAVIVLLVAMFGGGGGDTPAVTLPSAAAASGTDAGSLAAVTPETVQAVIKTLSRPNSYSRSVTAEDYFSGGSSSAALKNTAGSGLPARVHRSR